MARIQPPLSQISCECDPVDLHVGRRIQQRRNQLGMSEERLAEQAGLTPQQIHRHERGSSRIGASRLLDLAHALAVPVDFFFEDMPHPYDDGFPPTAFAELPPSPGDQALRREILELVRAYHHITDPRIRRKVYDLAQALAKTAQD